MRRCALAALLLSLPVSGCRFDAKGTGEDLVVVDDTGTLLEDTFVVLEDTTVVDTAPPADSYEASVVDTSVVDVVSDAADGETLVDPWTEKAWTHRRRLTVDGKALTTDLTDFVVPVLISDVDLVGRVTLDGRDIRFTRIDGTPLSFEIRLWDAAGGNLVAWVKLPKIGPALPNDFYFYYSNTAALFADDAAKTWSGEDAVWHFDEATVNGGTLAKLVDSTAGGHDGTQSGSESTPGVLLGAQRFDGVDAIDVAKPNEIVLGDTDCTFAAWIRTTEGRQQGILIKAKGETHETGDKLIGTGHDGPYFGTDHGWVGFTRASVTINDGKWHHVAWVQTKDASGKNEGWKLYVDGLEKGSAQHETKPDVMGHTVRIGAKAGGSYFDNAWSGDLDEVRYVKAARSPAWIAALERSQSTPTGFVKVGPDELAK